MINLLLEYQKRFEFLIDNMAHLKSVQDIIYIIYFGNGVTGGFGCVGSPFCLACQCDLVCGIGIGLSNGWLEVLAYYINLSESRRQLEHRIGWIVQRCINFAGLSCRD